MDISQMMELRGEVVSILSKNNCTIREAKYILTQAFRMIEATSQVQLCENQPLEF